MVIEIGYVFGYDVSQNMPSDLKTEILAFTVGSSANRLLTGWIPIVGKAVNNSSAALCTEEVGWKAANFFHYNIIKKCIHSTFFNTLIPYILYLPSRSKSNDISLF